MTRDEGCLLGELGIFSCDPLALVYYESMLSHQTDLNINAKRPWLHEMSKSYFFLGYFEYFKPGPVQCLNKLWHWDILTLSPTADYILMSLVCREGGFPLNTAWPESSTWGQKVPFFGGARRFSSGGNRDCGEGDEICRELKWDSGQLKARWGQEHHSECFCEVFRKL